MVKNPMAKSLSMAKFRQRIVKPKKGKGSYKKVSLTIKNLTLD